MLDNTRRLAARAIPLMLGVGVIGAALGAATPAASVDREPGASRGAHAPVRCVINSGASGGMLTLQGLVSADVDAAGSYRFTVRNTGGGGGAKVSQGGDFALVAGETATLGQVMLGSNGTTIYDARLTITVDGETLECSERVGGAI
ncbi:MAG: hypothetical protein KDJ88_12880 [Bauldia sp.]|nr:hypothetical protein [Bauldia sp.]